MKKHILSIIAAASVILSAFPASAVSAQKETDVIVELVLPDGADIGDCKNVYQYALSCANAAEAAVFGADCTYIYDTLLCGFHARLPEGAIPQLESMDFVKNVYISGEYSALSVPTDGMRAAKLIDHKAAEAYGLTGSGVKVAVIDSGFDVTHPAFDMEVKDTLDLTPFGNPISGLVLNAEQFTNGISDANISTKLPFVFDYFDNDTDVLSLSSHGTHVAGIIGAGKTDKSDMYGIAPNCQLLLMKIFDDSAKSAYDHLLIAAMEDAVKLGADVINLSLGHYSGSSDPSRTIGLKNVIANAQRSGCIVVAAAGNSATSASDGAFFASDGIAYPLASNTDYGTVSSPSASAGMISVASADNAVSYGKYLTHPSNSALRIGYTDTNVESGVLEIPFTEHFNAMTLEYVDIPGLGEPSDFDGIDVKGKLALIRRGTVTFVDKVNNAAARGAIGAIVYNNVDEDDGIFMELTGAKIPAVAISFKDGTALIDEKDKRICITSSLVVTEQPDTAGRISDFSSWGATPSLELKPDVTAIGGGVLSTVTGGAYDGNSGTSMASPQISGAFALLTERAKRELIVNKEAVRRELINTLINTAVPILQENGTEYSPRAQGAGLVNIGAALERELEITYKENGLPKAELFDGLGDSVKFTVTVKNLTSEAKEVRLGTTLSSDGYTQLEAKGRDEYFSTLEAVSDKASVITANGSGNVNRNSDSFVPYTFTLEAGGSANITLDITFDSDHHFDLSRVFVNGHFAEGFVYAETADSSVSLPYMGYIGDWTAAPVSDGSLYDEEARQFRGTALYVMVDGEYIPTGIDAFAEKAVYMKHAMAFSPNGDGNADEILLGASILRNFRNGTMTVTDSEGNTVYTSEASYVTKEEKMADPIGFHFFWDGGDGVYDRYKLPDGKYTMTVSYTLDYQNSKLQHHMYEFALDTRPPTLSYIEEQDGILSVKAADSTGILAILLYGTGEDARVMKTSPGASASFDISDCTCEYFYYEIIDYAYNTTVGKFTPDRAEGGK